MSTWIRKYRVRLAVSSGFGILIIAAAVLVRRALAIPTSNKNAIPVLAAGVTVTGVLTTAAVTLAGYLLRQSIDLRTTRLAEAADDRAVVEQRRLQMQTVIETVKLLSTPAGEPARAEQASVALLALAKLGELSLAIDLASEVANSCQLTARAASNLCDETIRSQEPALGRAAAVLIFNHWHVLESSEGQAEWPTALTQWPDWLDAQAKLLILRALEAWIAARPATQPADFRARLVASA